MCVARVSVLGSALSLSSNFLQHSVSLASANLLVHVVIEFIETVSVLCFAHVIFKFSAAFSVASTGEDPRVGA